MKQSNVNRKSQRAVRHARLRRRLGSNAQRPRLAVSKSNKNIYAQVIDDVRGVTIASSSTMELDLARPTVANAAKVGADIAAKAVKAGVTKVAFDTGGSRYHGKVKSLAEAARSGGLQF